MVGAVVVKDGAIVGEGYHPRAGEPHAEVFALEAAGDLAHGADIYVTLEPCNHFGRTPPCTRKIIAAGIKRVVAAHLDPNPLVAGNGVRELCAAGLVVEVGLKVDQARLLNEAFITYMTKGRPFVTAKWAMTLDGKIACASGDSRWVSGQSSRQWVHELRNEVDALMVGVGTVLVDDPLLTTRLHGSSNVRDPIRVILDSHLRTPANARVFHSGSHTPTWIACLDTVDHKLSPLATVPNVEILPLPAYGDSVDICALLSLLGQRGVTHVLLEGGATLNYGAFSRQVIDKVVCFVSPKVVGGASAPSPVGGDGLREMSMAWPIDICRIGQLGEDTVIEGYLRRNKCLPD